MDALVVFIYFFGGLYVTLCITALSITLYRNWKEKRENKNNNGEN
jgi:hypothetical protein